MIALIIDLLEMGDFYGISKEIDIAKGRYKLNTSFREEVKRRKRIQAWQK